MNEWMKNISFCTQTMLGLNSHCDICKQPSQDGRLCLKIFILPLHVTRRYKGYINGRQRAVFRKILRSTWFRLFETVSKLKQENSCLLKMHFRSYSWVEDILKQSDLCVYLLSLWYYAFCILNLHWHIFLWVVFPLKYFETDLCQSKDGRLSLFNLIKRS